jgi:hypothetical protein
MRQRVEIYENERYSFTGWSYSSLLPTGFKTILFFISIVSSRLIYCPFLDRNAFSTKDGSEGWNTLLEVESAYLSKGWLWIPETKWTPEVHPANTDDDGKNKSLTYFNIY